MTSSISISPIPPPETATRNRLIPACLIPTCLIPARLIPACLIPACLIAATVVMQMTTDRDGTALRPLTDAFDPQDQPLLAAISHSLEGKTERQKTPHPKASLAFANRVCASRVCARLVCASRV